MLHAAIAMLVYCLTQHCVFSSSLLSRFLIFLLLFVFPFVFAILSAAEHLLYIINHEYLCYILWILLKLRQLLVLMDLIW